MKVYALLQNLPPTWSHPKRVLILPALNLPLLNRRAQSPTGDAGILTPGASGGLLRHLLVSSLPSSHRPLNGH